MVPLVEASLPWETVLVAGFSGIDAGRLQRAPGPFPGSSARVPRSYSAAESEHERRQRQDATADDAETRFVQEE